MGTSARTAAWVAIVAVLATAGCNVSGFLSADSTSVPVAPAPQPTDRLHQQAQDALDRWAQAVRDNGGSTISFTGDLTSQIGEWEPAVATVDKKALAGGAIVSTKPLSDDRPGKHEVRWTDGPKVDSEVLSAAQALEAIIAEVARPCHTCTPLEITDANLATSLAETATGPAEVPTWVFTLKGTAVRLTRVAVDGSVTVTPGPWNADDPPAGISIVAARGERDSSSLDVDFVGAQEGCKIEYDVEPIESDQAVVVIVAEHSPEEGCPTKGVVHTAQVTLGAPLGDRVVLEGRQGLPVPVTSQ